MLVMHGNPDSLNIGKKALFEIDNLGKLAHKEIFRWGQTPACKVATQPTDSKNPSGDAQMCMKKKPHA